MINIRCKTIVFAILLLSPLVLKAQVLKNNGADITVKSGALVTIQGNAENASGTINIENSAQLTINGNFTVITDTVRFDTSSVGRITGNMTIDTAGVFYRNPGSLIILGTVLNSGILYNLGGLIEIGSP